MSESVGCWLVCVWVCVCVDAIRLLRIVWYDVTLNINLEKSHRMFYVIQIPIKNKIPFSYKVHITLCIYTKSKSTCVDVSIEEDIREEHTFNGAQDV